VFPEAAISLCIFGIPSTVISLVGVGKLTAKLEDFQNGYEHLRFELTDSDPLDALQFKQWQSELAFGRELRGSETVMRPQLQAPWMISEGSIFVKMKSKLSIMRGFGQVGGKEKR
jgi:hypothetical protein